MDAALALATGCLLLAGGTWTLWFLAIRRVAIPADRRGYLAAMAGAAALGAAALARGPGWPGGVLAVLGMLAAAAFAATVAISRQKGGPGAFRLGEPAPDFTAFTSEGEPFRLADTRGAPVLLKFFRGHW